MIKIPWSKPDIKEIDKKKMLQVINSGWFSMGKQVKIFEQKTASYLKIKYATAVNTGTAALDVALKCIDLKKDDEIIIPALTYIATGTAVLFNMAKPVFVDIDETLNINPSLIKEKITDKTKAIINIDLGGNPSNYSELLKISKKYDIPLIVDGAQSFGAQYKNTMCCTHGLINTTSFHIAKVLTTIEGGMLFTNNTFLYQKTQSIRNQGETAKYIHDYLGNNYRMTDIVASIGNSQIKRIKEIIDTRRQKAEYYKKNLNNIIYPKQLSDTINSYFFFLILSEKRDELNKYLNENGIDTRITYPMPINEQKIFRKYSNEESPVAKKVSKEIISLPIFNSITIDEQDYIISKINNFLR